MPHTLLMISAQRPRKLQPRYTLIINKVCGTVWFSLIINKVCGTV